MWGALTNWRAPVAWPSWGPTYVWHIAPQESPTLFNCDHQLPCRFICPPDLGGDGPAGASHQLGPRTGGPGRHHGAHPNCGSGGPHAGRRAQVRWLVASSEGWGGEHAKACLATWVGSTGRWACRAHVCSLQKLLLARPSSLEPNQPRHVPHCCRRLVGFTDARVKLCTEVITGAGSGRSSAFLQPCALLLMPIPT